jgi:hypothetical protein
MDIIVKVVEGNGGSRDTNHSILKTILQAEADGYELILQYVGENDEVLYQTEGVGEKEKIM